MPKKLTEDDYDSISYFWKENRSLERWTGWPRALPLVEKECPEILIAYDNYKTSIRVMNAVVEAAAKRATTATGTAEGREK